MILDPVAMRGNAVAGFTSVKGRSHTFDARADGYSRGEAINCIVCRGGSGSEAPLAAGIVGSAVRQDGRSASLTAPNGQAQQGVLSAALMDARLHKDKVATFEAHGTGTALGDPIEAGSLAAGLLVHRDRSCEPLLAGSLKAIAGHTEPGAGIAGMLKLLMQLMGASMPPNAQLRSLNPYVRSALLDVACGLPVQVAARSEEARHGGVSSYGYSGTIAHSVLASMLSSRALGVGSTASLLTYRRSAFAWRADSHPFAQRLVPLSGGDIVLRSNASGMLPVISHHVVQGRVVFPGAGYLEMGRAGACIAVGATASLAALRGVYFLQPLAVGALGLHVECRLADGRFEVRSGALAADAATLDDDAAVHCSGTFSPAIGSAQHPSERVMRRAKLCLHAADVGALYDGFFTAGLEYGPGYRTLVQAWGGGDGGGAALARLRSRSAWHGTQVHPADLDDALCAGAVASSGAGSGETRLPFAVDDALVVGSRGELWAVRLRDSRNHQRRQAWHTLTKEAVCLLSAGCGASRRRGNVGAPRGWAEPFASAARRLQGSRAAGRDGAGAAPPVLNEMAVARHGGGGECGGARADRR